MLAGQNPVSSYCLMPPLRFALLFLIFFFHHTVAPNWNELRPVGHRAPSAHDKPLNQYLSLDKRCQESFFSLLEDLKPSSKVLSCSYHSAIQRVLDFFLCPTTFRDLGQVGLQLQQRPQKKRQNSKLSRLTPTVWAVALPDNNKIIIIIIKKNYLLSRSTSVFLYLSLQFRKVRYIIRSGVEERARGRHWGHFPFVGKNKATADKLKEHQAAELKGWLENKLSVISCLSHHGLPGPW